MAGTSDEEMESLVCGFDHIYQGYRDALLKIQSLKASYNCEASRREALEATCNDLKQDNERLRRLYGEYMNKFANQMKYRAKRLSLNEELEKANGKLVSLKEEHLKTIEMLKQDNDLKILDLEKQISCFLHQKGADQALTNKLQQDLATHETQRATLINNVEQVKADLSSKYNCEIQDLKDWILVEQEENNSLRKKLEDAQNELQDIKKKQAEQQRDSVSIHHVETLKQKIMKLRKENESLKRQLKT